jgi:hypothetical protein
LLAGRFPRLILVAHVGVACIFTLANEVARGGCTRVVPVAAPGTGTPTGAPLERGPPSLQHDFPLLGLIPVRLGWLVEDTVARRAQTIMLGCTILT